MLDPVSVSRLEKMEWEFKSRGERYGKVERRKCRDFGGEFSFPMGGLRVEVDVMGLPRTMDGRDSNGSVGLACSV